MHVVKRGGVWTEIDPDTRRAEILVRLPSAFLSVRLSVYGLEACKQMLLSPPPPKGRGVVHRSTHPVPVGSGFYAE